jgi:hypothetical protein
MHYAYELIWDSPVSIEAGKTLIGTADNLWAGTETIYFSYKNNNILLSYTYKMQKYQQ